MKTFILIFCSVLINVFGNEIFQTETTSKKCYFCENNCDEPEVKECPLSDKCFASSTSENGTKIDTKGCIDSQLAVKFCENKTKCYTCDGDLCNTILDPGVKKCYVCIDECPKPATEHNCQEVLTATEGQMVKAACLSYEITNGDEVTISKGCISDNLVIRSTCLTSNVLYEEVKCSICDSDLCNGDKDVPPEENYADECYVCENVCEKPLEIQTCPPNSKCLAGEMIIDGQKREARSCIEVTDEIQQYCDMVNNIGGNCTICDTNLCNGIHEEEDDDNSVTECYHCENNCQEPLEVHQCKDILGGKVKSKCIASILIEDGEKLEWRGCVEDNKENQKNCDEINQQGFNCTICDTNLCNGIKKEDEEEEDDKDSVEECYYCEINCTKPLETHKCKDILGDKVKSKCVAAEWVKDGFKLVWRGCIEDSVDNQEKCTIINEEGGNCTICSTNLCNGIDDSGESGESDDDNTNSSTQNYFSLIFLCVSLVLIKFK